MYPLVIHLEAENILLLVSMMVLIAISLSKLGWKIGVPVMLLFLLTGMLAGPDCIGVEIGNYEVAEFLGHLCITVILLTSGLETSMEETRPLLKKGLTLSSLGLLLTVLSTGAFIYFVLGGRIGGAGTSLLGCILLATVMSSTDSATVFSSLRSKRLHLREDLGPLLELECGSNDPMAYVLTLLIIGLMTSAGRFAGLDSPILVAGAFLLQLAWQVAVGFGVGLAVGHLARFLLGRIKLPGSSLYAILILMLAFFASGLASLIGGNGLMAIYVAAIIIGNTPRLPFRKDIFKFFDGITWLALLLMFLLLGLLARPSQMPAALGPALLIGAFLLFVGRPLGVFVSLLPYRGLSWRAKLFISWVGLKGAGPILFALCTVLAGVEGAAEIFNIVFCITLLSQLVQGLTLVPMARKLGLSIQEDPEVETFGMEIPEEMGMLRDHTVAEEDLAGGATLRDLHLPHGIRVVMVRRDGRFIVPHGSLELKAGDRLVILLGDTED